MNQRYITILKINGKHSHRLAPLINKLSLPTLVVADLDSAEPTGHHKKAEPNRGKGLISGNYSITGWLIKKNSFDELLDLPESEKIIPMTGVCEYPLRIAYQLPININYGGKTVEALSRTFEDSLIYSNMNVFDGVDTAEAGNLINVFVEKTNKKETFEAIKTTIFEELKKSDVKAEFALDLIYLVDPKEIVVPQYIDEGLRWLENVLCSEVN